MRKVILVLFLPLLCAAPLRADPPPQGTIEFYKLKENCKGPISCQIVDVVLTDGGAAKKLGHTSRTAKDGKHTLVVTLPAGTHEFLVHPAARKHVRQAFAVDVTPDMVTPVQIIVRDTKVGESLEAHPAGTIVHERDYVVSIAIDAEPPRPRASLQGD